MSCESAANFVGPVKTVKRGPGCAIVVSRTKETRSIDEIRLRQRALDSRWRFRDQTRLDQSVAALEDGSKQVLWSTFAMALLLLHCVCT